jgi:adenylate cyclase
VSRKFLWLQIAWISFCSIGFLIYEIGSQRGHGRFIQNQLFTPVQRLNSYLTDLHYAVRGPRPVRNPIVIVEIDESAIEMLGRWPWRRDYVAYVIDKIFEAGAEYVGLDLFFSEAQRSVPEELEKVLQEKKMASLLAPFDFDAQLQEMVAQHRERLVLAWASESECRPQFSSPEYCPVTHPDALATHPPYFSKFAMSDAVHLDTERAGTTPLSSVSTLIPNLERLESPAKYAGFVNDYRDKDGLVRRTSLMTLVGGRPYATLPLMLAKLWKKDDFDLEIGPDNRISRLMWKESKQKVGANALGVAQINFRGKERSFPYVSVGDILQESEKKADTRDLASESKSSVLKGAIALVGLTAIGLTKDVVATPFDSTMPGVEVHANILDNLISGDFLKDTGSSGLALVSLLLLVGCSILLILIGRKLEARPALLLSMGIIVLLGLGDFLVFFPGDYNLNLAFHYLAFAGTLVVGLAAKYIAEEENRKFLRSAFSMYVAPAVVDSIVRDPGQLSLGGRKEQLSILFSDIRGFTTFSEKLEPKVISEFLNEYLGMQTEIVFSHGGTLDKYIGDALMAFWGAPLKLPNHAALACQAVVSLMDSLEKHRARLKERYGIPVRIGIGLHSGEVSVGNMGSARSFNYTVVGDNVNLTSRLEGATKYFGVTALTTRETLDLAQSQAHTLLLHRSILDVKLKGKNKNVELIEIRTKPFEEAWLSRFNEGRSLFTSRKFEEAKKVLTELDSRILKETGEGDGPSTTISGFCDEFLRNPPPKDWDGSWALDSK